MRRLGSGANFARYRLDDIEVVALRDGYVDMPTSRLRQDNGRPFGAGLPSQVDVVDGQLRLSVNAFLVIEGDRHVLIDTGAGNAWEPSMGLLLRALGEAGVARHDITTVAFTHTHVDHVSGLVATDGTEAFPRLERLLVPQDEISHFDGLERLARYRQKRVSFGDGFSVTRSITARGVRGHSPGHTAFEVSSGQERLLIWGDIVHVPSIQFAKPELTWEFDGDQALARESRMEMLDRAAQPGTFVAGAHLDFPGIGRVTKSGAAYAFSPD